MTRLPSPPALPVVLREEVRTALHGLSPAWRVGAVLLLVAIGLSSGLGPSAVLQLPAPSAPPLVDFAILVALVLAGITWSPAGKQSAVAWAGVRHQPVDPRRRIVLRAVAGSLWALLAGGMLIAIAVVGALVSGRGSGGLLPGAAVSVSGSVVVAYLYASLCVGSSARVTLPALAAGVGIFSAFFLPGGAGGVRWLLLEGTVAPGAALLGTSLPAVLLWGGGLLVLLPRTVRLDRTAEGPPSLTSIVPGQSILRMHIGLLLGEGRGRMVAGCALAAPIGGIVALEPRGASILLPLTWGMALEAPFHFARGASMLFVVLLLISDARRLAPSAFRLLGALPVSRRFYLLVRGGALLAIGLSGAVALHLLAGAAVVLFEGEPASATVLAQTLWMVLMAGVAGLGILTLTERPLVLWVGLCIALPVLVMVLVLLAIPLHEATGGWLPGPTGVADFIVPFRNQDVERWWVPGLIQLALVTSVAWYSMGPGPLRRSGGTGSR